MIFSYFRSHFFSWTARALFAFAFLALAGFVVMTNASQQASPPKLTQSGTDIAPVSSDFRCTGMWACQEQFAAIVKRKVTYGDITLNHNQTYACDTQQSKDDVYLSGKQISHMTIVSGILQLHGSGARITSFECTRGGKGGRHLGNKNLRRIVPKAPLPTFINISMYGVLGRSKIHLGSFNRLNAIIVQITGNKKSRNPSPCRQDISCWQILSQLSRQGRLIMVGGQPIGRFSLCGGMKEHCITAIAGGVPISLREKNVCCVGGGTSWAAPQVTAALQLLSAMWPYLSQQELVRLVFALAEDAGNPGIDAVWGHGKLSFKKLFTPTGVNGFKCNATECVDLN